MNTQPQPINTRAAWRPVLRPLAHLLIAAQLALTLQPLSAIAQDKGATLYNPQAQAQLQRLGELNQRMEQAKAQKAKAARSPADQVSEKLARTEELVKGIRQDKDSRDARRMERRTQRLNELKEQLQGVDTGVADVRSEFEATGQELKRKNLPAEILQRHQQAQADIEQRAAEYKKITTRLNKPQPDEAAIEELDTFFQKNPASRRHTPIDPRKLPWGAPKATPRMPTETKAAWHQSLSRSHKVQLAQAGNLTTIGGVRFTFPPEPGQAPTDADLAATPDIQLTPAIRAKAAELNHNPVAIHNWVRNNIQWLPTWGSIQGSDATLQSLRGNAMDTASLTIALLRASGIPARYQFGTIDVPAEQAQNWVGGVSQPEAVLNLLYQGGIAARGIASAGRIRTIRMEHVWVSAYVNWIPGRGAKDGGWDLTPKQHPHPNAQLNAWAPLDVSYKQYVYTTGMNLQVNVPLDSAALLAAVQQGATVTPNYTQNLNQTNLQAQLASYQNQIKAYINSTPGGASATVGDVLGNQRIQTRNFSMLPGTLAHPLVVLGNQRAELPDELRWKITFKLYASASAKAGGSTLISQQLPLTAIGSRRLSVAAVAATPADQELLAGYAAANATSLPVYLVRQRVQLKLDDQVLAQTEAQQMGAPQWWDYVLEGPNFGQVEEDFKYETAVGDALVLGVNGAGTDFQQIAKRFNEVNPNTAHENLHHLALGYFARADWSDQALAALQGFVTTRLPSVGLFASPLSIQYSWGVARKGTFKSYALDIRRLAQTVEPKANPTVEAAATARINFNVQIGLKNSYLEGAVFEEVFDLSSGRGLSAVALLKEANENGIGIHSVTSGNLQEFLAAATGLSTDLRDAIRNYSEAGYVVLAPDAPVDAVNWVAQGYIAIDPQTGAGAYIIGTGANGGELLTCEEKWEPLTSSLSGKILTFLVLAAAAALIAAGLAAAPPSGGVSLGGSGVLVAQMMAAVGMTTLVFTADANAAGKCKSDKCHRGTVQAQGRDISQNRNTVSVGWAEPIPLTVSQGLALLENVKSQLTPSQLRARADYFAEAEAWIRRQPPNGICGGGPSISFGPNRANEEHVRDQIRVDIKVYAGEAFSR